MKFFLTLLFFFTIAASSEIRAQSKTDTLQLDSLKHMKKLNDIYPMPGEPYHLHHFVAFISLEGIDPYAVYNQGSDFEPDLIEKINLLKPGNKIAIQPFALNSTNSTDQKPVKFPRKDFYIK